MVLFLLISSSVLTWSTRPPFGVDALPRYYHLASFNYGDMKARDIGRIVDVIWTILCLIVFPVIIEKYLNNIMPDSISGDNWEVGKSLRFFFVSLFDCLLEELTLFDNNCRDYSWCWLYSTSERGKILNYKVLRQAGLIIPKRDFKSGSCLWIPAWKFFIWGFLCWVMFTFRFFSNQGYWGCIQSNLLDGMVRK